MHPDSSAVLHRHCKAAYPIAVSGDGPYIIDNQGKRYLDASGGAAVSCLGHSNARVREAMHQQIDRLAYAHSGFFTTEPMEELAARLIARAPEGLARVYFVSGGSEAMEAAIKLGRQYWVECGRPEKRYIITRWQSYHGNTLGALSVGGNRWRREPFRPLLLESAHHISPCYAYREQKEGESREDYALRAANELEAKILELGPDNVAMFTMEPVVGATMGAVPSEPGYLQRIRAICDRYDVLLVLDEVMCGMGRTGRLFACEEDGVAPDLLAVAKGLGAGYQPIGAMLCSQKIYDTVANGSGFFQHGHTYLGHAVACAASLAVLEEIETQSLLTRVQEQGAALKQELEEALAGHPHVGDIRGRGLFLGLELVADKQSKTPFDYRHKLHAAIKNRAMQEGLMCYPMGGTVDGQSGDHILLAPPFIIEEKHRRIIVSTLAKVIDEAIAALPESGQKAA